ncbi:hypothetical protein [Kerstersia sp.]|uniref:hypothetical protein n=1 Tax=Kerstersia sp. TaxID=1930783 RepID=UPI003F90CFF9
MAARDYADEDDPKQATVDQDAVIEHLRSWLLVDALSEDNDRVERFLCPDDYGGEYEDEEEDNDDGEK